MAEDDRALDELIGQMNEHQQLLFACDCVEHVLYSYEEIFPDDGRPRRVVALARRHIEGEATAKELGNVGVPWDIGRVLQLIVLGEYGGTLGNAMMWLTEKTAETAAWTGAPNTLNTSTDAVWQRKKDDELAWQKQHAMEVLRGAHDE
jgi:hypothetical protein